MTLATDSTRREPTEAELRALAAQNPAQLIRLLRERRLSVAGLTNAAEIAGALPTKEVAPILLELLAHPSAVVREGAVLGLGRHVDDDAVRAKLHTIAESDASSGVRATARDMLDGA